MIGWILIGIGTWLIYDDLKEGGKNETISKNGDGSLTGDRNRKSGASDQKPNRNRGIKTPIHSGIPTRSKGVTEDELYKEFIREIKPDKTSDIASDHSGSESNSATTNRETESIKGVKDAESEDNSEVRDSDDGDDVHAELSREHQSDRKESD